MRYGNAIINYGQVADWQKRLAQIGRNRYLKDGRD